jgi:hypothetical protein
MADLTYFIGRPFVALYDAEDPEGNLLWGIELEGDGRIENKDPSVEKPEEGALNGTVFIRPIFSELDTRLQFGVLDDIQQELTLTPTLYTISDPTFVQEEEGEIYPQVPFEILDTVPEDPSPDRVADGPEEEPTPSQEEEENA